jgi:glycine hydroxymethyltransferase
MMQGREGIPRSRSAGLAEVDPEVMDAIRKEEEREATTLELIASENLVSRAVMEAQGCIMTNKYAEGYPGSRYYGGCQYMDEVERLTIDRAKRVFGAEHVNVQPHSGAQANMAATHALMDHGDTLMGLSLSHGGHLTHGAPANYSSICFKVVPYGVDRKSETINYAELREIARQHKPKMIIAGATAYPRTLDFERFAEIARDVGAFLLVDMAHIAGLVAAGLHPNPTPHADVVTTTTHKTLRGPRGGMILSKENYAQRIDRTVFPGMQGGPLMHVIAAKAVALKEALSPDFVTYQEQVLANARVLGECLAERGCRLVAGGTDTHLLLVDLTSRGLTGRQAEEALEAAGVAVNRNPIPFDEKGPRVTSGIRLGTPAVTTRGMKEKEMDQIASLVDEVLSHVEDERVLRSVREKVRELCGKFPIVACQ